MLRPLPCCLLTPVPWGMVPQARTPVPSPSCKPGARSVHSQSTTPKIKVEFHRMFRKVLMNLIAPKWTWCIWKILIAREQSPWPILNKVSWLLENKKKVRSILAKTFLLKDSTVNKKKHIKPISLLPWRFTERKSTCKVNFPENTRHQTQKLK